MEYLLRNFFLPSFGVKRALRLFGAYFHDHLIPHHRNNYHPHVLSSRNLALFSLLALSVKIFTISLVSLGPAAPAFSSSITQTNIISLTNSSRQEFGLGELSQNSILATAAQAKAEDMLEKGYFSHNTPEGETPWEFIERVGYNYLVAGENLAVNFIDAESMNEAWMNSPTHKANILHKAYEEIGIGIAKGEFKGKQAILVVQIFGSQAEQKIAVLDEPTKVQTNTVPVPESNASTTSIIETNIERAGESLMVSAKLEPEAVKAVVAFGEKAVMLNPVGESLWEGSIPLASLKSSKLELFVSDINGNQSAENLGNFAGSTIENFNVLGAVNSSEVSLLGFNFNPKQLEQKFYLLFIAGILASLILAIAIKRHVQHPTMIANASFTAIFATLLLVGL